MGKKHKKVDSSIAYIVRLIFTLIPFIYILVFIVKGIALIFMNGILRIDWINNITRLMNIMILIHGIIGIYYILSTNYKLNSLCKERILFFLQIVSSIAALIVVISFIKIPNELLTHSWLYKSIDIVIAVLFGFHVGNGFYNACISLGIAISERAVAFTRNLAWLIATISIIQIFIALII